MALTLTDADFDRLATLLDGTATGVSSHETAFLDALDARANDTAEATNGVRDQNELNVFDTQVSDLITEALTRSTLTVVGDTLYFRKDEDNEETVGIAHSAVVTAYNNIATEDFLAAIRNLISIADAYALLTNTGVIGVSQLL